MSAPAGLEMNRYSVPFRAIGRRGEVHELGGLFAMTGPAEINRVPSPTSSRILQLNETVDG